MILSDSSQRELPNLQMQTNTLRRDIQELEAWKEEPTEDVTELVEGLEVSKAT